MGTWIRQLLGRHGGASPFVPCCAWLESMLSRAGKAGFHVEARLEGGRRNFLLQAQALSGSQTQEWFRLNASGALSPFWSALAKVDPGATNVKHKMGSYMTHCVVCGSDLVDLANRQSRAFDQLAEQHRRVETIWKVRQ